LAKVARDSKKQYQELGGNAGQQHRMAVAAIRAEIRESSRAHAEFEKKNSKPKAKSNARCVCLPNKKPAPDVHTLDFCRWCFVSSVPQLVWARAARNRLI